MRVISGKARGFKLAAPKGTSTRPTGDRIKEALFSILAAHIENARVLDLFAGTGALGIEALSRGAKHAVFIDSSPTAVDYIKKNAAHTNFLEASHIIRIDARKFLLNTGERFDIIFLDPPYHKGLADGVFSLIKERGLLNEGGLVSFEYPSSLDFFPIGFDIYKNKIYNNIKLSIFSAQKGDFNGYNP